MGLSVWAGVIALIGGATVITTVLMIITKKFVE